MALNIPDRFFSPEDSGEAEEQENLFVLEDFPNFKARATNSPRRGKALTEERSSPLEGRKPRRDNFLSLNLSSNSKFSPARNRFVHHQVNNVADNLAQDISQIIQSNPLPSSLQQAPATSPPPETRRRPRIQQQERGQVIRLEDLREILKNSMKNVDSDLEVFQATPDQSDESALPPLVLESSPETNRSPRQGRQDQRFLSPAKPSQSTLSFSNGNIDNTRLRTSVDFQPQSPRVLGSAFQDLVTERPRLSSQLRTSLQPRVNDLALNERLNLGSVALTSRPSFSQVPRFPPVSAQDFQNAELRRFLLEQNRTPSRFSLSSPDQRLALLRRLLVGFRK